MGDMNVRLPAVISLIFSLSLKNPTQLLSEQIHNKLKQATYTKAGMEDGCLGEVWLSGSYGTVSQHTNHR